MNVIKVFYWDGMPNFGDALNPLICKNVFNTPIQIANERECDAVFIGSLLDDFLTDKVFFHREKKVLKIWGSGFINDVNKYRKRPFSLPEKYFRKADVLAVRGKYSKHRLEKILNRSLDCVLGDPGILAPLLVDTSSIKKKYALGIIPHHLELHGFEPRKGIKSNIIGLIPDNMELKFPVYQQLRQKISNSVIIDMEADPIEVIKRMAECETILSSALHGLIVADGLDIPNMWSSASEMLIGRDYKFKDYYSTYNLPNLPLCLNLKEENKIPQDLPEYIQKKYMITKESCSKIKQDLLDSFPYRKGENNED